MSGRKSSLIGAPGVSDSQTAVEINSSRAKRWFSGLGGFNTLFLISGSWCLLLSHSICLVWVSRSFSLHRAYYSCADQYRDISYCFSDWIRDIKPTTLIDTMIWDKTAVTPAWGFYTEHWYHVDDLCTSVVSPCDQNPFLPLWSWLTEGRRHPAVTHWRHTLHKSGIAYLCGFSIMFNRLKHERKTVNL